MKWLSLYSPRTKKCHAGELASRSHACLSFSTDLLGFFINKLITVCTRFSLHAASLVIVSHVGLSVGLQWYEIFRETEEIVEQILYYNFTKYCPETGILLQSYSSAREEAHLGFVCSIIGSLHVTYSMLHNQGIGQAVYEPVDLLFALYVLCFISITFYHQGLE